ncbi:ABC transporter ATP-binding protein [Pseudomonadales bacterium]|nr:ABC transporter ATP-binding protein [Pseudomonadales bacterium]MDG1000749.1 ABC transporter ATP-binding protein [Pseudomonadales bacterium]MDG1306312.1 ABC transporter ATP-binding protein [Pseudomonadales bacterium]MDG1834933.1 ABC transporter ATP-binding protein [Pseudomonadales bacterium]MDG1908526.1 ABC transporter ATP-binding protein [Pseudomonadales bacterium]|tara:strand:- start:6359 stop:7276 length:918 start_codon:yes stop_codon:yes gene_type:complete
MNSPKTALEIKNLSKTYSNDVRALRGIDLSVERGDFFALLGPNGAGKSTTIGILFSLINKSGGTIEVCGIDIDENFSEAKRLIGIVPQEFNFNVFEKVRNIVVTQGGYYGLPRAIAEERADKYLKKLGLWDKRNDIGRELSGGMKRRLMIARALVHEPELLVLDEPTAGVDIEMRREMWNFLRDLNENDTTIILTTHYLEEAEMLCRNIAIIDQGAIVHHSSMKDLLRQLHTETFVLDARANLPEKMSLGAYGFQRVDDRTLEVEVDKERNLNGVFEALSEQGIEISSMRNKTNRLEEMFVSLLS